MRTILRILIVILLFSVQFESQASTTSNEPETISPKEFLDWPAKVIGKSDTYLFFLHVNSNEKAKINVVVSIVKPLEVDAYIVAYSYILDDKLHVFSYENGKYTEDILTEKMIEEDEKKEKVLPKKDPASEVCGKDTRFLI